MYSYKLFMSLDRLKLVLGLEDDEVPFRHRYVHTKDM